MEYSQEELDALRQCIVGLHTALRLVGNATSAAQRKSLLRQCNDCLMAMASLWCAIAEVPLPTLQ